jgi:hypothetical protein
MGAEDAAPEAGRTDVLVSQIVIDRLSGEPPEVASAVASAILRIEPGTGRAIRLNVPGDPPGTRYWAVIPAHRQAPAVIYRETLPGEKGRVLVTALMDRDAFIEYVKGLEDNAVVQGVAAIVAAGTIATTGIVRPVVSPMGAVSPNQAPTER